MLIIDVLMTINYYSKIIILGKNDILINIIHIINFMQNVFFWIVRVVR